MYYVTIISKIIYIYILKKEKAEKTNLINGVQNLFTFRRSAPNARSRNYVIYISYGKNLSKRRLIGKFQPTNFDSKPDTEKKDEICI